VEEVHVRQEQINSQIYNNNWPIPVFLRLGSAKGCPEFRETKMRNGGRALLVVLNLWVGIEIRVATFDTKHSVANSTQTIAASVQKFPDILVKPISRARN